MTERTSEPVVVIGAGGHAKVVISTLRAAGRSVSAVLDDAQSTWGTTVLGVPVTGPVASLAARPAVIAVGSNAARARIAAAHPDVPWQTAVHPSAIIAEGVTIGPGTVLFAGAIVQPDTVLGAHVIVNTSASVDHDCVIDDFVHIAPGVHLAGDVRVARLAFLGLGTSVLPGIRIGADAKTGAGAVVVRDLPPGAIAIGIPARPR